MIRYSPLPAALVAASCNATSFGGFTTVADAENSGQWFAGAGDFTTIPFTGLPTFTLVQEQYASFGIHFSLMLGANAIRHNPSLYWQDEWGLGSSSNIVMQFDMPMRGFAAYHWGGVSWKFYSGTTLVYSTDELSGSTQLANRFSGFFGGVTFDRVRGWYGSPTPEMDHFGFDNIYFSTVPAPATAIVALGGMALGCGTRRTRRS